MGDRPDDPFPNIDPRPRVEIIGDEAEPPLLRQVEGFSEFVVISVRSYGARGDDIADDTDAVQAAIDDAPDGAMIYFPPGVYRIGRDGVRLEIRNRKCLTFFGDGECSVLKRQRGTESQGSYNLSNPAARSLAGVLSEGWQEELGDLTAVTVSWDLVPGIMRFRFCTDITIRRLAFDANGMSGANEASNIPQHDRPGSLGNRLVEFLQCHGVRILGNLAYDSDRIVGWGPRGRDVMGMLPPFSFSRSAFGFVYRSAEQNDAGELWGSAQSHASRDILIADNHLKDLCLTVRHARRVRILRNTLERPVPHGIVVGGLNSRTVHEDIETTDNVITDPFGYGIWCGNSRRYGEGIQLMSLDDESELGVVGGRLRRIRIRGNTITKADNDSTGPWGGGILVGLDPESRSQILLDGQRMMWEEIRVEDNEVAFSNHPPSAFDEDVDTPADLPSWKNCFGIDFNLHVRIVETNGPSLDLGHTPHFDRCAVRGNTVRGFWRGIKLQSMWGAAISDNSVLGAGTGILLTQNIWKNHVQGNRVGPAQHLPIDDAGTTAYDRSRGTTAFGCFGSLGQNWFQGNVLIGQRPSGRVMPRTAWSHDRVRDVNQFVGIHTEEEWTWRNFLFPMAPLRVSSELQYEDIPETNDIFYPPDSFVLVDVVPVDT